MFVAVVVTKRKGFSSVLTFSKNKNQINIPHLAHQRAGFMVNPNGISIMVVPNCMNIRKTHLSGTHLFQMEGGER